MRKPPPKTAKGRKKAGRPLEYKRLIKRRNQTRTTRKVAVTKGRSSIPKR